MKKFKATFYGMPDIIEVDVFRETDKSVFFKRGESDKERRESIASSYHKYFDTREEAKDCIIKSMDEKIDKALKRSNYLICQRDDLQRDL